MLDAGESTTEDELQTPGKTAAGDAAAAASLLLRRPGSGRQSGELPSTGAATSRAAAGIAEASAPLTEVEEERRSSRRLSREGNDQDCPQDSFFDWGSLDEPPPVPPKANSTSEVLEAPPKKSSASEVMEDAVEGLVSFATSVVGSVAGAVSAVGDAVNALGNGGSTAGAVLSLGDPSASTSGSSAQPASKGWDGQAVPVLKKEVSAESSVSKEEPDPSPMQATTTTSEEEMEAARAATLVRRRAPSRGPKHVTAEAKATGHGSAPTSGSLRIAMLVNGSEGDVRPMVALAKILVEEKGHQVRILTNANLVHICLKHSIDAVPVFADSQAVIQKCGGMRGSFMEAVMKPTKIAEKWLKEHEGEFVPVSDALEDFEPHAILAGAQVTNVVMRYEKTYNIPVMPVFLSRPWLEEEFFNLLVNQEPPRPSFYAVSEVVDRKSLPFPRMMRTSAWTLNDPPSLEDLSPGGVLCELKDFLDSGPPPVAVGWGSMLAVNLPPAEMLELALRALMQAGRRGIVIGGWAELDRVAAVAADGRLPSRLSDGGKLATFAKEQVCFVPWAPHDWLFPQCCCIIHHGGVGTLHAVLRACRPSVVTPICADQFASAEVVSASHVGIGFTKALPDLKPKDLAHAIGMAVNNVTTVAAQTVGRKLLREEGQGVVRAAEMVDGFVRGKVKFGKSGQWVKRVAAKTAAKKAPH